MKLETKVSDIKALIELNKLTESFDSLNGITVSSCIDEAQCVNTYRSYREVFSQIAPARREFNALPKERRDYAQSVYAFGKNITFPSSQYSGQTKRVVLFGDKPEAETFTGCGSRYSRSCKYRKTDATHQVTLHPEGLPLLHDNEALRMRSVQDGLKLIALYPDDRCVWMRTKGKRLISEHGWVTYDAEHDECYHSTKSREDARAGLTKKVRIKRQLKLAQDPKVKRRLVLITRLCNRVTATIRDARAFGK
jgi:hypothetical protein